MASQWKHADTFHNSVVPTFILGYKGGTHTETTVTSQSINHITKECRWFLQIRHEIQSSGTRRGLAGWLANSLSLEGGCWTIMHVSDNWFWAVAFHGFLLCRSAALDVSRDDFSFALVAVGSQGKGPRDDVTSKSNDWLNGTLDILWRCSPHPAEELEWCLTFQMPSISCPKL